MKRQSFIHFPAFILLLVIFITNSLAQVQTKYQNRFQTIVDQTELPDSAAGDLLEISKFIKRAEFENPSERSIQLKEAKRSGNESLVRSLEISSSETIFNGSEKISFSRGYPGAPTDDSQNLNPPVEWRSDILVRGSANYDWRESYPAMAAASNSTIYLAWQNDSPFFGFQNFIQIYSSTDGGVSWQHFGYLGNTNYEITQPSIAVGEGNGNDKLVIAYIVEDPAGAYVEIAITSLSTYGATIIVPNLPSAYESVSKPCVWTDNFAFDFWYIYLTVEAVENSVLDNYNTLFWRSINYGVSMESPVEIFGGSDGDKWVDPDGTFGTTGDDLFVAAFNVTDKNLYFKKSTDFGVNWSDAVMITTVNTQISYPVAPDIEAATDEDNILIAFTDNTNLEYISDAVHYSLSTDAGSSWSEKERIISGGYSHGIYPQLVANELGGFWHLAAMDTDKKIYYNKLPQNLSRGWQVLTQVVNDDTTVSESFPKIGLVSEWITDLAGVAWSDSRSAATSQDRDIYFDFEYGDPVIQASPSTIYFYQSNPVADTTSFTINNFGNVPLTISEINLISPFAIITPLSFPLTIHPATPIVIQVEVDWTNYISSSSVNILSDDPYNPSVNLQLVGVENGPIRLLYSYIDDQQKKGIKGNGDGVVNPGETVDIYMTLYNAGPQVDGCIVLFNEASSNFNIMNISALTIGTIAANDTLYDIGPIIISADANTPDGFQLIMNLDISAQNGGPWDVYDYYLVQDKAASASISSSPINAESQISPNPSYLDSIQIANIASTDARNLSYHIFPIDTLITTEELKNLMAEKELEFRADSKNQFSTIQKNKSDNTNIVIGQNNLENSKELILESLPASKSISIKSKENLGIKYNRESYILFDNGPIINGFGTGYNGGDESILQTTSLGMLTFGWSSDNPYRLADNFTVTSPNGWSIETFELYLFRFESDLKPYTIEVNYRIWSGEPEAAGSVIIFGDINTNRFIKSEFINAYRVSEGNSGYFQHPIFKLEVDGGFSLPPGEYWLDFQIEPDVNQYYFPPITINGQSATGNAIQYFGSWGPLMDVGQQGMPFKLKGYSLSAAEWLVTNPTDGSIPAGTNQKIDVFAETNDLTPGFHYGTIVILTDDPDNQITTVPVTLNATLPQPQNLSALSNYNKYVPLAWSFPDNYSITENTLDSRQFAKSVSDDEAISSKINSSADGLPESISLQGFNIYRSTSQNGPYSLIKSGNTKQYYIDSNVTAGQNYYYVITSVYDAGESGYSNESSAAAVNGGNVINSNPLSQTPIVDGFIDPLEWSDAAIVDLTLPNYDSTITAYIKNDEYYLYIAVGDRGVSSFNTTDISLIIAFDENMDREYPQNPPSGEGTFANLSDGVGSLPIYFNAISGTWQNNTLIEPALIDNGVEFYAGLQSAHAQYEIKIDLTASNLNAMQGDSIGILIYYEADRSTIEWSGAFPKDAIDVPIYYSTPQLPASFGTLVLANNSQLNFYSEFLVEDNCGTSEPLFFGTAADATDGYDNLYDQYAQAIPPVGFDARFIVEELNLIADFRSTAIDTPVVWNIHYQSDAFCTPFTFSWMPNQLSPTGDFRLVDGATNGMQVNIDMRTTSSYIDNEGLGHLRIIQFPRSFVGSEMNAGWNMVALAFVSDDQFYETIYPHASVGSLFSFNNGYSQADTLQKGKGYWLKNDSTEVVYLSGVPFNANTISLQSGWNMIGGVSCDLPFASVSDPGNIIVANSLFGFENSYVNSDTIKQGKGYWLKANADGSVTLTCGTESQPSTNKVLAGILDEFKMIEIVDSKNMMQQLYFGGELPDSKMIESFSMPPLPPTGVFDVRFTGDFKLIESDGGLIEIRSAIFPIRVKFNSPVDSKSNSFILAGLINGEEIFSKKISNGEFIQIEDEITQLRILDENSLPTSYALYQNYPNPFNPRTTIKYSVPEKVKVSLVVFDILGRKVKTLVDDVKEAGIYTVNLDFPDFASGVYIYQIKADNFQKSLKFCLLK